MVVTLVGPICDLHWFAETDVLNRATWDLGFTPLGLHTFFFFFLLSFVCTAWGQTLYYIQLSDNDD